MKESKTVSIKCKGAGTIELARLLDLQGELKELTPDNEDRLRRSISKHGFSAPLFLWQPPGAKSDPYLLDGTQRRRVLEKMVKKGWKVPPLPFAWIHAKTKEEAMAKLLQIDRPAVGAHRDERPGRVHLRQLVL